MKTLLATLLILSTLTSAIASQDGCSPTSRPYATQDAVENFMQTKLGIVKEDIVHLEILESKNFISRKNFAAAIVLSPVIIAGSIIEGDRISKVPGCMSYNNAKNKIRVEFNRGHEFCSVNLMVKIKQDLLDPNPYHYHSTVKQKYAPVCN
ncbi:MAG: hypothetical protein CME62_10500 [Halobacteriovoraceae bacterium]|nr:hypothetical protein [Halobacteriovoraceae bacterium]|tara:strand:- start:7559 stop:8011 length:453 start_codon:yes stop_codon:yes gene_type:complete